MFVCNCYKQGNTLMSSGTKFCYKNRCRYKIKKDKNFETLNLN